MRILLDESVPRTLARELTGHEVQTVQRLGWAGLKNGALLQRATGEYDVLITGDRNLEYQQNLTRLQIAIVVLVATSNRIEALKPLVPELLRALISIRPGQIVHVSI